MSNQDLIDVNTSELDTEISMLSNDNLLAMAEQAERRIDAINRIMSASLKITNVGLEKSKPIITLEGTGTIEISLNGFNLFKYVFPENETKVVIDSLEEEAYLDNVLKNRNMLGTFPIFEVGENTISWSGNLTKISIEPKSRWL